MSRIEGPAEVRRGRVGWVAIALGRDHAAGAESRWKPGTGRPVRAGVEILAAVRHRVAIETAAEMQMTGTFLCAGWEFVDENENGTEGIRRILEGRIGFLP